MCNTDRPRLVGPVAGEGTPRQSAVKKGTGRTPLTPAARHERTAPSWPLLPPPAPGVSTPQVLPPLAPRPLLPAASAGRRRPSVSSPPCVPATAYTDLGSGLGRRRYPRG